MSAAAYAEFLTNLGHRVEQTESGWWESGPGRTFSHFPYHHTVEPSREETDALLGLTGTAARFCCPVESGSPSYLYTVSDHDYSLETLSSNTRSKTRRGLKRCEVRRLEFSELEGLGAFGICAETLARQAGRDVPANHTTRWQRYASAANNSSVMECHGAFQDGQLVAFIVAGRIENCMNLFIARSSAAARSAYPNNALMFSFLQETMQRPDIDLVSFGWKSIRAEMDSLDSFKSSLGFQKRPVGQRIEFSRWLRPLLVGPVVPTIARLAQLQPERERFRQVSGLLKLYRQQPARVIA